MMNEKYLVGDKVVTADNWDNGFGRIIPKESVVKITRAFKFDGINMYDCEYNGESAIYDEEWLGKIYNQPKIGGWIPCSDPPKHDREVLIFNGKSYSVGYYNGKTWVNAIHPVEWQKIRHE